MTDQTKSVETLQTDVDQVAVALAEAKKLEDETLKKTKAETALLKVESTKTAIETAKDEASKKLKTLEGKTDATSKAEITKLESEIKEYEEMLTALDASKTELTKLKTWITAEPEEKESEKKEEKKDEKEEKQEENPEEKSDRNRIQRQRDGVTSKEEWKTNTWANIARSLWWLGIIAVGVRGIKKIFGLGKKKEKKEGEEGENTEKKSFWQRPFGKILKWTGIGTWAYYLIHGIVTGRRSLRDFFDRNKKAWYESNDPKKFDEVYEKESKEKQAKHDELWKAVNDFFSNVYGSDVWASWSDMLWENSGDDKFDSHIWTMPAVLDDGTKDIWDILDGTSDFRKELDGFGAKISKDVWKEINPLNRFSGSGASEEELAKLDKEDVRKYQAYRKMLKVQVFLHQKEKVLIRRLVAEKLGIMDYATASDTKKAAYDEKIDDAMDDDNIMDAVETKMKTVYYGQKITWVMTVFAKYGISNEEMVPDTEESLKEVDQDKNDLIGDTFDRATSSENINNDTSLKSDLITVCDDFDTKINNEDNQLLDFDNFFIGLGDAWLNMEAWDKQEVLKEIWYTEKIGEYNAKILAIKEKINNGTATKKDIDDLKKTIEDYYMFKKDILLWISFVHEADDKNSGLARTLLYIWGKLLAAIERVYDAAWWGIIWFTVAWIATIWTLYVTGMAIKGWFKYTATKWLNWLSWIPKDPGSLVLWRRQFRRLRFGQNETMKWIRRQSYKWDRWCKLFEDDFKAWKIKLAEAQQIIDINGKGRSDTKSVDELLSLGWYVQKWDTISDIKIINSYFDKNKNFRLGIKDRGIRQKVIAWVKEYDVKLTALTSAWETKKAQLLEDVFSYARFKKWDELSGIVKHIDAIDINDLDDVQIKSLAKKLGRRITAKSTAADIAKNIDEVKKATEAAADVVDDVTSVLDDAKINKLNNLIDTDLKTLKQTLTNMGTETNPGPNFSKLRKNYYEQSIQSLETFKKNVKTLGDVEYDSIIKFTTYGFDLSSVAKLHRMTKVEVAWADLIQEAMESWDLDLLKKVLDDAWKDTEFLKYVAKSDIDDVVKNLDIFNARIIASWADEVGSLLKGIVKLFTKFM